MKDMRIREAREKAIHNKAYSMSGRDLIQAFFYIANSADIQRMADVLGVEDEAQKLKKQSYKKNLN